MSDAREASAAPALVRMTPAHVDALMSYERDMFGTEAWSERSYREEIADTRNRYYVAVEGPDDALLGWAGVLVVAGTADVLTVGVVPSARRQGLARRMLAALYSEAARRGASEIFLDVRVDNEAAIALYQDEGFVELGRRRGYYDAGRVDSVVMRRAL
jgi:[ribosomal protein S18]-alanine N-acetyltransferase